MVRNTFACRVVSQRVLSWRGLRATDCARAVVGVMTRHDTTDKCVSILARGSWRTDTFEFNYIYSKMTDDLIELVRHRKVIYDSKCKEYKDHLIRNAAWEEIAEILKEPVNKCKDDWAKLRNAFASVLKRRRYKKSGQAATAFVPWKHEESMSFLLPYMECRNTTTNVMPSPESPPTEDSLDESIPASPTTPQSTSQASTSRRKPDREPKLQELYNLMKSSQDLRRQKQNKQDMDETDLFFLSMSKEVKALPKLEQTKIKLDLHTAISQAIIRQLEQRDKILRTPIKITNQRFVQLAPQHQSSAYIPTTAGVQSPTTHAQSPIYQYIKSSSIPTTCHAQKHAVSNSDDSQRFIQSNPRYQSSTYIQNPADVQPPTDIQSPQHAQSSPYIQSSSVPLQHVVSDDLKAYYDSINFDGDDIESDG